MTTPPAPLLGYPRTDGRVGIRDVVAVVYLVECARAVADAIAAGRDDVHVIGFGGCYPSSYAHRMLELLCTHPNVGAVALVSLGCEGFDREGLAYAVAASGRPVATFVIQAEGGTRATVARGRAWVDETRARSADARTVPFTLADLVVGTICGGSDGTSGITANPVVGRVFDRLVAAGGTAVFEETGELIGCEQHMAERAVTAELGAQIVARVEKAAAYYTAMGHGSFSPGNAEGGLTTLEEKSLGAYSKSGSGPIHGVVTPGQRVPAPGLYLLDVVPEGPPRWGFPNINDNAEIAELVAAGSHVVLFTTGRGSVVGSAVSPVLKICANPETYRRMSDDMDVDAGRILEGREGIDDVADEVLGLLHAVAAGRPTASEELGHREFVLTYKSSEPTGPACLPTVR
ncbi:UxaA family hydrolase [Kineosporia sp. R_H_3]|uniref:UxaA family hydrolase n=1 Tax=Kineosporia sp. R_H_3 TaxID=1961848 RepID=UPI0018E9CF0A|nr:UxaA family hydrolase [Kineosporia sp. R_H_3]